MDANRIVNIILTDLSLENLKLQEKLEFEINSTSQVETKTLKIKELLKNISLNELSLAKFQTLVSQPNNNDNNNNNNNNKDLNTKQNGKIY
jgi:endo-alpha-1,4-polygalactosaminidase (GH114 family)